jgi:hypothetical protein
VAGERAITLVRVRPVSLLPLGLLSCCGVAYLALAGWDDRYHIAGVPSTVTSWLVVAALALMLVVAVSIGVHDFCHVAATDDQLMVLLPLGVHRWMADYRFPIGQQRGLVLRAESVTGTDRVVFTVTSSGRAVRTFKLRESWLDAGTRTRLADAVGGVIWAESDDAGARTAT